jgi:tRNA threonylcarbamoyladenosine biosynthesis protein TsaB
LKILALETSTEACSVALALNGNVRDRVVFGQQHSSRILSMVDALLAEAGLRLHELDAVAFGRGPGFFTGLRIGTGVVQGLAFGADLPVVPVSSLAALAHAQDTTHVLTAVDARMSQVYWGTYTRAVGGALELLGEECVTAPQAVPLPPGAGWRGVGSGWDRYAEALTRRLGTRLQSWLPECYPRAREVAVLATRSLQRGEAVAPEQALPVYVRDEVARKPRTR